MWTLEKSWFLKRMFILSIDENQWELSIDWQGSRNGIISWILVHFHTLVSMLSQSESYCLYIVFMHCQNIIWVLASSFFRGWLTKASVWKLSITELSISCTLHGHISHGMTNMTKNHGYDHMFLICEANKFEPVQSLLSYCVFVCLRYWIQHKMYIGKAGYTLMMYSRGCHKRRTRSVSSEYMWGTFVDLFCSSVVRQLWSWCIS